MQRFVLCVALLLMFQYVANCDVCYTTAPVPFANEDEASAWVSSYCECFDKVFACDNRKCVTDLWEHMHSDPDLEIVVDGKEYAHWRSWNAQVQTASSFMDSSSHYTKCELVDFGDDYVVVDEICVLQWRVPGAGLTTFPVLTVDSQQRFTFNSDGTFARKVYTSTNNAFNEYFSYFNGVSATVHNAAVSLVGAAMPSSVAPSRLAQLDSTLVVFGGSVLLVMYLALMYTIVHVARLCRGRSSGSNYYGKIQDLTTVTEIEDANQKQELIA